MQAKILAAEEKEYFQLMSKYHNLDSHISSKTQILEQPGKCHATLVNYSVNTNGNNLIFSIPKTHPSHLTPHNIRTCDSNYHTMAALFAITCFIAET